MPANKLLVPLLVAAAVALIGSADDSGNAVAPKLGKDGDHLELSPIVDVVQANISNVNVTGVPIGRTFLLLKLLKEKLKKLHDLDYPTEPFQGCVCVNFYLCGPNGTVLGDGNSYVDIRFRRCTGNYEVCCYIRLVLPPTSTTTTTTMKATPSTIPTTTSTTTLTTTTTTTPRTVVYNNAYCYCVLPYQCVVVNGQVYGSDAVFSQRLQPYVCTTGLVCCSSYYPGVAPVPLPGQGLPPLVIQPQPQPIVVQPAPPIVLPAPALPPIVYGQSCVCTLISQCSLGYVPVTGLGNIDPRLVLARQGQPPGTCTGTANMCCKLRLQASTSVQQQPQINIGNLAGLDIKNPGTSNACECVGTERCADGQAVTYDGIGAIDPRFGPCMSPSLVCCRLQGRLRADIVFPTTTTPSSSTSIRFTSPLCGIRNTTYADSSPLEAGSAYFAEFPWMAILTVRRTGSDDAFKCGGSLISSRAVLTAAHCVESLEPSTLFVRLGELDTRSTTEPLPHQERVAQRIIVHPQYYSGALYNDVAIVVLSNPFVYDINVRPVCLPMQGQEFAGGTVCYATGWGSSAFGSSGNYQVVMRKVDLPMVDNAECQSRLRQTRLGPVFRLHSSFVCAGGVENKDTCHKDGGGPLVCQDTGTGRFMQAGIISWGIGCGNKTPGVYASVAQARHWILRQLETYKILD